MTTKKRPADVAVGPELKEFRRLMDLEPTVRKKRDCLRCRTSFNSAHSGNRMCLQCRKYTRDNDYSLSGYMA